MERAKGTFALPRSLYKVYLIPMAERNSLALSSATWPRQWS